MRILHTSDWHLGRTLHGEVLHEYQREFHDFLVNTVRERAVDAVIIAGDVYDRSVPSVESVELLDSTLARLAELATVIMTPGNHDSAPRLGFGSQLMREGVHILAKTDGIDHPVAVHDQHGEVLFFGLPFLNPDEARFELAGEDDEPLARSHHAVTLNAMDRVRAKIQRASKEKAATGDDRSVRSVVIAHTFVTGGTGSDSERDLTIGGVDSVPASVFDGIDYLALGHLHGCQNLSDLVPGTKPQIWYSGSPLAFSFSEKNHKKAVLIVDMDENGQVNVEKVFTPVRRRLVELRGSLQEILEQKNEYGGDWIHAIVREESRPAHLQEILRDAYPHLLFTEWESTADRPSLSAPEVMRTAAPVDVVSEFLEFLTGAAPNTQQNDIIEHVLADARSMFDRDSAARTASRLESAR